MTSTSTPTATVPDEEPWSAIIRPEVRYLDMRLGELWQYRDLIVLLIRRDFVAQYKQTVLGPVWHLLNPLFTTVVFTVVFATIGGIPTDGAPPFLFYLSGTILWNYFSRVLVNTSGTLIANAGVFGKVYFPRLVVPISATLSQIATLGIQFGLFLVIVGWSAIRGSIDIAGGWIVLTPVLFLLLALISLGSGIIVSSLTTKYRDLAQVMTFAVTLLMYITPVIYPASAVPNGLQLLILVNPLTPIIEAFRFIYFGGGSLDIPHLLYSAAFGAVALGTGIILFNRVERSFVDTV